MQTIHATERTGGDGTLTLRVPLGQPDTEFEIIVVAHPKAVNNDTAAVRNRFAVMDAIRTALAATGRDFGDSAQEVREDRDR